MHFNCRVCEETEIILIKPWHWGESKGFSIGRATNYIVPKQILTHWRRQRTCSHLDYSDGYLIKRALCKYDTARSQDGHRQTQKLAVNRATPWPSWLRCIDKQANRIRTHLQPWYEKMQSHCRKISFCASFLYALKTKFWVCVSFGK